MVGERTKRFGALSKEPCVSAAGSASRKRRNDDEEEDGFIGGRPRGRIHIAHEYHEYSNPRGCGVV